MALQDVIKDLRKIDFSKLETKIKQELGSKEVTRIIISKSQYATKMKAAFRRAVIASMGRLPKPVADIQDLEFEYAIAYQLIEEEKKGIIRYAGGRYIQTTVKGIFIDSKQTTGDAIVFLVLATGVKTKITDFYRGFNNRVFLKWYNEIASDVIKGTTAYNRKGGTVSYKQKRGGAPDWRDNPAGEGKGGILGAHDEATTEFHLWLKEKLLKAMKGKEGGIGLSNLGAQLATWGVLELVLSELELEWKPETIKDPKTGIETEIRVVKIYLAEDNPINVFDFANKEKIIGILTQILGQLSVFKDPLSKAASTSHPYTQRQAGYIRAHLMRQLLIKNKKRVITVKQRKEKFDKPKPGILKKSTKAKSTKQSLSISLKSASIGKGKESGEGKQASVSQAADLARLRKYIQGRLPAEVRRNMGRPALRNRTGRFSNSVQLLSLTQAKATIMAKYTYLLSPYQTFENAGRKRWPMAYNPKLLIAKSIRNLALGRIQQKLTVRRV